ncbi:MAG: hypothetical protein ABFS08_12495 [Pseudomonadota bacterium]
MFSALFNKQPLLDDESIQWLFDTYAWALRNFDAVVFRDKSILVLPNDRFFPGRVESVEGMAGLICDKVKEYAGLAHWPTRLLDGRQCQLEETPKLLLEGPLRGGKGIDPAEVEEARRLPILYDPALINNPEAMIASFAHSFAHYLGTMAKEAPPGGEENWAHITEVLASFLGFGLVMANSALNVRIPRCGSCGPAPVDRQSFLSEHDMTYALAIFCALKEIPNSEVLPHLKSSLRGFYKRAMREIKQSDRLQKLKVEL